MYSSWLLSLLVAAICACNSSAFLYKNRIVSKSIIRASTNLLETPTLLTEIVQVKVIVSGKNVQGPWYRTTVRHETVFNRKCKGSLTERSDSTTEIVIQGPKNRVDSFVRWVKRGPGLSQIVRVDAIEFQAELSKEIQTQESPFMENTLPAQKTTI